MNPVSVEFEIEQDVSLQVKEGIERKWSMFVVNGMNECENCCCCRLIADVVLVVLRHSPLSRYRTIIIGIDRIDVGTTRLQDRCSIST